MRKFSLLFVLAILFLLGIGGLGAYLSLKLSGQDKPSMPVLPTTISSVEIGTKPSLEVATPSEETSPANTSSSWKTFRNEEQGFKIKYPSEDIEGVKVYTKRELSKMFPANKTRIPFWGVNFRYNPPGGWIDISIYTFNNPLNLSLPEWLAKEARYCQTPHGYMLISEEDISIRGLKGKKLKVSCPPGGIMIDEVYLVKNSTVYAIWYSDEWYSLEMFKKFSNKWREYFSVLLSSFEFIE